MPYTTLRTAWAAFALIIGASISSSAADAPPNLTPEELATPQQQALLQALAGDPYGHRAADFARAGCPMLLRPRTQPSDTWPYGGYWVGGGQAIKGHFPTAEDGTFGWDYFGLTFNKRIALNWSRGKRTQGGTGSYKTDK
jgi:hypothetical protein